jgi:hypothetical protein
MTSARKRAEGASQLTGSHSLEYLLWSSIVRERAFITNISEIGQEIAAP